jgi:hypothetical protein
MIEDKQQTFSDEFIRTFLLGGLDASEQMRFEHSLFADDNLEQRVRLAELELSDDYAAHRLERSDRELFQHRFLLTTDRERTVAISKALHDTFALTGSHATFWHNTIGIFDVRRHALRYAFATVTLMLLLLGTALLIKRENLHRAGVTTPRVSPKPTATAVQQPAHHPSIPSDPTHNETSPAPPSHDRVTTGMVLEAGTPLESAPTISTSGDFLIIQLTLDGPFAEAYGVSVMTVSGEAVFSADKLPRVEEKSLDFDLPTASIKPGDFKITLTRLDGESGQNAGTYYFRVR